jgi:hypothetical protein
VIPQPAVAPAQDDARPKLAGDRIEIGADLLVPTFWFIPSGVEISLNVGLELIYRL